MKKDAIHISAELLCLFFIFPSLVGHSAATQQDTINPLNNIEEYRSNFIQNAHLNEPPLFKPRNLNNEMVFPCQASRSGRYPQDLVPRSPPVKEQIIMNGSRSEQPVNGITAFDSDVQRDIIYDESQSGDPDKEGLKNSLDVTVSGNGQGHSADDAWIDKYFDDNDIESRVDNALSSIPHGDSAYYRAQSGSPGQQSLGNYMNIDVSGINVQAINTVQGGSAVATSNIIIKPVQIINCPSEAEEKLK